MSARFEFRLPLDRRLELDQLAEETGLSAADIVRLGLCWALANRNLLKPTTEAPHAPQL
jgi:hypothetical protein